MVAQGTVKSFTKNSPESQHRIAGPPARRLWAPMSVLQFITAVPLNVRRGSGCYIGTRTLIEGLRRLGTGVAMITPRATTPVYTATRILFYERLRWRRFNSSATIGIDADGYATLRGRNAPTVAGQSYVFEPYEQHRADVLEHSTIIEIFTPCRDELKEH